METKFSDEEFKDIMLESQKNLHRKLKRIELLVGGIGGLILIGIWVIIRELDLSVF
jgi:predicted nucleic acid-binding Zn ribbon protein